MILVIHAHPDSDSFTVSIAREIAQGLNAAAIDTQLIDLYRIPESASRGETCGRTSFFPPVMDTRELHRKTSLDAMVQAQMNLLENAEGYVVVHPDWWGGPPAVLKGWIDRVLRPGTGYEIPEGYGHREAKGLLAGRKALVAVSGDAGNAGPLEEFWVRRVWDFCGVEARLCYFARLRESNLQGRKDFLKECVSEAESLFISAPKS